MPKVKTAISIEDTILKETGLIASELAIPRSQLVSLALEDYIRRYRNQQVFTQINSAYATPPDLDEIGALEVIRSHRKKHQELEDWK